MTGRQPVGFFLILQQGAPAMCGTGPGNASEAPRASRTSRRMLRRTDNSETAQGKAMAEAVASAATHEILRAHFANWKSRQEKAKGPIQIVYWRYGESSTTNLSIQCLRRSPVPIAEFLGRTWPVHPDAAQQQQVDR